jgi:pimeloyl-ACP methyl ester carboxylesterase
MTVPFDVDSNETAEPAPEKPQRRTRPLLPSDDPFYVAPVGFGALAPGTVIRSREVDVALLGVVPQHISAWQLLYRSNDLHLTPEAAVTTVLLPAGSDSAEPRPLIGYQCAIDAISDKCFPSYALQRGARTAGSVPPLELLVIANALERGWAVSIADHEGLHGYFAAPREPGYRILDGIRAAQSFAPVGLHPDAPIGLWGYSGGGMATSWVAEMAPEYAPELDIVGAALGAPVGDPGETFIKLNGTTFAGLPAIVVAGLRHIYPGLGQVLREHVNFEGRRLLDLAERSSTIYAIARLAKDDFDSYIDAPLADVLALPEVMEVFEELRLGQRIPTCPLFVVQAVHDQIISVEDVDGQVRRYTDGGAHVTYVRDRFSEHILLMPIAAPAALKWLEDRFAGRELPAAETKTVLSMLLSPSAILGLLATGATALKVIFGRRLRRAVSESGPSEGQTHSQERSA